MTAPLDPAAKAAKRSPEAVRRRIMSRVVVDANGCWLYRPEAKSPRLMVQFQGSPQMVYRILWQLDQGPIPEGLYACHKCDVPKCCNPAHLFLGTNAENIQDAIQKGRHRPGGHLGLEMPRPSLDVVQAARNDYAAGGWTYASLALKHAVSRATIGRWIRGKRGGDAIHLDRTHADCGTDTAYGRHKRLGETACPACVEAHRIYQRALRARSAA